MKVAFVGDSLTFAWTTDGARIWQARYASHGALNFGVPGDRTDDVLARIEAGELDASEPDAVVFLAGTNDLGSGRSPAETAAGVAACLAALRDLRVLMLALLPRGDGGATGYAAVAATNRHLARAGGDGRVSFADLTHAFVDERGLVRAELYDADLLHLAPAGYAAWADALDPELARLRASAGGAT